MAMDSNSSRPEGPNAEQADKRENSSTVIDSAKSFYSVQRSSEINNGLAVYLARLSGLHGERSDPFSDENINHIKSLSDIEQERLDKAIQREEKKIIFEENVAQNRHLREIEKRSLAGSARRNIITSSALFLILITGLWTVGLAVNTAATILGLLFSGMSFSGLLNQAAGKYQERALKTETSKDKSKGRSSSFSGILSPAYLFMFFTVGLIAATLAESSFSNSRVSTQQELADIRTNAQRELVEELKEELTLLDGSEPVLDASSSINQDTYTLNFEVSPNSPNEVPPSTTQSILILLIGFFAASGVISFYEEGQAKTKASDHINPEVP